MSERVNPDSPLHLGVRPSTPSLPQQRSASPVVLVPATPYVLSQASVAADVTMTPPQANQLAQKSYAQVASRPAASSNVVVWPLNSIPASAPAISQATVLIASPVSLAAVGGFMPFPETPVIRPLPAQLDDIEVLELPPPLLPPAGTTNTGINGYSRAGVVNSPLPPSSPIYVPSTASATPTPAGGMSTMLHAPFAFGNQDNHSAESYDDFWANFSTPVMSETNLPSALHTPRILVPRDNETQQAATWPAIPRSEAPGESEAVTVRENVPPGLSSLESHPPVADRFRRKRRRGASPISGERVKKSARKKGKGKGKEVFRLPSSATSSVAANPWASERTGPHAALQVPQAAMPPVYAPSPTLSSSLHTPYSDFARRASVSTSFYGRFNESGSHPTPHRLDSSPSCENSSTGTSQQPNRSAATVTGSLSPPHLSTASSVSLPMSATPLPAASSLHAPLASSLLAPPAPRDSRREHGPRRVEEEDLDARRRLRDILSDPASRVNSPRPSRRTTVEDIPEEGELYGPRPSVEQESRDVSMRAAHDMDASLEGFTLPQLAPSNWRGRVEQAPWMEREARSRPRPFSAAARSGGRLSEEWSALSPQRMMQDEASTRRYTQREPFAIPTPPVRRSPRAPDALPCQPDISMSSPTNRIRSLDVFDVGDDDNLPDAVRRGGTTAEGDDERPTPIAREGDPEVHRHDPEAHLRGLSDDWVQEVWADPTGTSITLSTYNPHFTRSYGANRRAASDIRRSITHITGESSFLVIAPDQAHDHHGRGPVEWAVTGLTREGVDRLLRRRVWSFKYITFFPRRRALVIPRWLLAVEGFLDDNIANIERAIRSTFERPQVRQRIEQMIRANPEFGGIPTDEAFRRIMASLRVTIYTLDNETVVANVFLRSPTQSVKVWRRWIQELRDLTFGSYHTAIARVRRVSSCSGCLGVDHPSHLCPFPRMPGWNGPEAAGGSSYSVDGRERRSRQTTAGSQPPSDASGQQQRRMRNQPRYGPDSSQSGPSRSRATAGERDWYDSEFENGRERAPDRGRGREPDRSWYGQQRRGRRDPSGPPKSGREGFRSDGRR